jgi:hypothetical protein
LKHPKDLTGLKFNKLTAVERLEVARGSNGEYLWKCQCECGKQRIVRRSNLLRLVVKGCEDCGGQHRYFGNGSQRIPPLHYKKVTQSTFYRISKGAKERHIEFSVSMQYMGDLFEFQGELCALSGLPIQMPMRSRDTYKLSNLASLDRIDNSKGYVEGNVQWVHKDINYMKQWFSQDHFISMCAAVARFQHG